MIKILSVTSGEEIKQVSILANQIWYEHYTSIIGRNQVEYMLNIFQSEKAIYDQISQNQFYYIILHQEKPAGYFSFYLKENTLFLSKLYILNSCREKGLGKLSMLYIEKKSTEYDLSSITLTVNKYNSNSIKAYEKLGFRKIDSVKADIGNGYFMDDFVMIKYPI